MVVLSYNSSTGRSGFEGCPWLYGKFETWGM